MGEQFARGRRVCGYERSSTGERLEGLVRNDPLRLVRGAEDPEGAAGAVELLREPLVLEPRNPVDVVGPIAHEVLELAVADDPQAQLGRRPRRGEDRLQPVQGDQLADEESRERILGRPPRAEYALLGAHEADLDALRGEAGERAEMAGVGPRVGDDEVGAVERVLVDPPESSRRKRPRPE